MITQSYTIKIFFVNIQHESDYNNFVVKFLSLEAL